MLTEVIQLVQNAVKNQAKMNINYRYLAAKIFPLQ